MADREQQAAGLAGLKLIALRRKSVVSTYTRGQPAMADGSILPPNPLRIFGQM